MKPFFDKHAPMIFGVTWILLALPLLRYLFDESGLFDEVYAQAAVQRNAIIMPALLHLILGIGAFAIGYAIYRYLQPGSKWANLSMAFICAVVAYGIGYGYFFYISLMAWAAS